MMIPDVAERAAELEQLCRAHHVRRLDLFGSAAAGRFQSERSDLDFLVDFHPLPFQRLRRRLLRPARRAATTF